jgi:hypothetical protein
MMKRYSFRAVSVTLGLLFLASCNGSSSGSILPGQNPFAYDSIPKPLSNNIASLGFQPGHTYELGDGLNLTRAGALSVIAVVMDDWACQTGGGITCSTAAGSSFSEPITVNVYNVTTTGTHVGSLIATKTQTFNIPFRPSADPINCTGPNAGKFYSTVDQTCVSGLADSVVFDFSTGPPVNVPSQIIVSVTYNTTTYGYSPYGTGTTCWTSGNGCPYDSLNVAVNGNGGPVGSPVDPDGLFVFYRLSDYCDQTQPAEFRLDTGPNCWTGFHPQIAVGVR